MPSSTYWPGKTSLHPFYVHGWEFADGRVRLGIFPANGMDTATAALLGSPVEEEGGGPEPGGNRMRTASFASSTMNAPRNSVCGPPLNVSTVHSDDGSDWRAYRGGKRRRDDASRLIENPNLFARELSEKLTTPWIQNTFRRRECVRYVPVEGNIERCGCGRPMGLHSQLALSRFSVAGCPDPGGGADGDDSTEGDLRWSITHHTRTFPTDAFGTLVFQGGAHAHKAQYIRLAYDSDPADIMYLLEKLWKLEPPRLVITVHGGMSNFEMQEKLGRQFREGLLKAAQTTGAWIITAGIDSGVVRQVAQALDEAGISARMRSKVVTIGVAPWGNLRRKERLIGMDTEVGYDSASFGTRNGFALLNDRHSYFLLADNGTSGRYGADLKLRMSLEEHLARTTLSHGTRTVPVVAAVLEGGTNTIASVHKYLTTEPRFPVIVCDGSGRASDLIAFAARYINDDGRFPREVREQLLSLVATVFPATPRTPQQLLAQIVECARRSELLTIFRYGEEQKEEVDHAILTSILRRQNLSLPDQLALTLVWNRVDVARTCFASRGERRATSSAQELYGAMVDALRLDRVDFVECLLEKGVSMKKFLTFGRLELLYNMDEKTSHSIRYLAADSEKRKRLALPNIGEIIEKLMGGNYKSSYSSRHFKSKYQKSKERGQGRPSQGSVKKKAMNKQRRINAFGETEDVIQHDFTHPFNDLMIWAILTRRPDMARCMWQHGEDAMAKAQSAIRLYKSIARLAEAEYIELEMAKQLRAHAEAFRADSVALLDECYRRDDAETVRLLTAEQPDWGGHTCMSLAVLANNKSFLAHECCQMLLAELWHGSLRVRSGSNLRVLGCLLVPPAALLLSFKADDPSPRMRERLGEGRRRRDSASSSSSSSSSSEDEDDSSGRQYRSRQSERQSESFSERLRNMFTHWPGGLRRARSHSLAESTLIGDDIKGSVVDIKGAADFKGTADTSKQRHHTRKRVTIFEGSDANSLSSTSSDSDLKSGRSQPPLERMRAFYSAPICKFWTWCVSFHLFLIASIYVLLIETPRKPTLLEWSLLLYAIVFACEHFRKFMTVDQSTLREKCSVFLPRFWNSVTTLALFFFFLGFAFRCFPEYRHSYGRVLLSCSNVLWHVKILDYLSTHPRLGPYIMMAAKMVVAMSYIIVLLLVTIMAFGVSRQAITYPHEQWKWLHIRDIFYKPYFMLYGEVYAGEIDTCDDEGKNCVAGYWLPPILMTAFMLIANILLINMLIAIFNNIFNETNDNAREVWLFQRYDQVLEYNDTPILPPPFTLISHFLSIACHCYKKSSSTSRRVSRRALGMLDISMKLFLDDEEMRTLYDFEEDCIDELMRRQRRAAAEGGEQRWTRAVMQTEMLTTRISELVQENFSLRSRILDMETRLGDVSRAIAAAVADRKKDSAERGKDALLEVSCSTQSLPDSVALPNTGRRRTYTEYTSITDGIRLSAPFSSVNLAAMHPPTTTKRDASTLSIINSLRHDATLRKYDEALYASPAVTQRRRLDSSSMSIAHDLREMDRTSRGRSLEDFLVDIPSVVIERCTSGCEQTASLPPMGSNGNGHTLVSVPPFQPIDDAASISSATSKKTSSSFEVADEV